MSHETYLSRRSQLLKSFDRSVSRVKHVLVARYGVNGAHALVRESRHEHADLIPQIPYIGDRNPLLILLLPATRYLALYRTFQKGGRTVEEARYLAYEIGQAEFEALPGWVRRAIEALWFSRWFTRRLQRRAAPFSKKRARQSWPRTCVLWTRLRARCWAGACAERRRWPRVAGGAISGSKRAAGQA